MRKMIFQIDRGLTPYDESFSAFLVYPDGKTSILKEFVGDVRPDSVIPVDFNVVTPIEAATVWYQLYFVFIHNIFRSKRRRTKVLVKKKKFQQNFNEYEKKNPSRNLLTWKVRIKNSIFINMSLASISKPEFRPLYFLVNSKVAKNCNK